MPASVLNELRRQLYALIDVESSMPKMPTYTFKKENHPPKWMIKTDQPLLLKEVDLSDFERVVVELNSNLAEEDFNFIEERGFI